MYSNSKRLLTVLLLMVLSVLVTVSPLSVYASTPSEDAVFVDVAENDDYADSIKTLVGMGVVNGYDDGTFKPDSYITLAEAVTITEKAFGNRNCIPEDWSQWNNRVDLDISSYESYNSPITYETAAELLLKMNNFQVANTQFSYYQSQKGFLYYLELLQIQGYESKAYPSGCHYTLWVTRGEFCDMVCFTLDRNANPDSLPHETDYKTGITVIPYEDSVLFKGSYSWSEDMLLQVPEVVRRGFKAMGGTVYLGDPEHFRESGFGCVSAFYLPLNKSVYVMDFQYEAIPHEFGHFVSDVLRTYTNWNLRFDDAIKDDAEAIYIHDDFYMSSAEELFAEAFSHYCWRKYDMKVRCPELYEYIDDALKLFVTVQDNLSNN